MSQFHPVDEIATEAVENRARLDPPLDLRSLCVP
jgi:hypothetical protein